MASVLGTECPNWRVHDGLEIFSRQQPVSALSDPSSLAEVGGKKPRAAAGVQLNSACAAPSARFRFRWVCLAAAIAPDHRSIHIALPVKC